MNNNKNQTQKEIELLDIQMIATVIYIGSLILSIALTYNDKQTTAMKGSIFTNKQSTNLSIFNRSIVVILTFIFLYINYENRNIAKSKKQDIGPFNLQVYAAELSMLATIIVLYVVIKTSGEQYSIVPGIGNPSL